MTWRLYIMTSLLYYPLGVERKYQGGHHELRHPESSNLRPLRGRQDGRAAVPVTNRLRVLRAERDWSQADLAARLGVSRQTVNAIETGRYDPSLPLAFKLSRMFKLPIEKIFEQNGN